MTRTEDTRASPKRSLAPDTRSMDDRAARAWTERMAVDPLGDGRYAVRSESGRAYTVDPSAGLCTCPDSTYRGARCKHLRRVAIEINRGDVPAPGYREGACDACGDRAFLPEGEEPALCGDCRVEPGDPVTDRETGDVLVVAAVTDRRAHEVSIPGAERTVADHPTNEAYPDDDLVVEAVYPFSGDRRYAFPASRLERRTRPT